MKANKLTLRMCVVCKKMKDKSELVRVVKNKSCEIFVDETGKAAGRGAFVCKEQACLEKCKKQKGFNRAFKCDIPPAVYDRLLNIGQQLDKD